MGTYKINEKSKMFNPITIKIRLTTLQELGWIVAMSNLTPECFQRPEGWISCIDNYLIKTKPQMFKDLWDESQKIYANRLSEIKGE